MYITPTTSTYQENTRYYSKSGDTYTLLVVGTDYTIGNSIGSGVYERTEYDRMYFRAWGSSGAYQTFPYKVNNTPTLPENDVSANDVDMNSYTNTKGKTIRNRVRHDVAAVDFNVETMSGAELHEIFTKFSNVWLDCLFFYEASWGFVSKKMYRSATVKYHRYYVDENDPDKNIYQNVQFGFVEE